MQIKVECRYGKYIIDKTELQNFEELVCTLTNRIRNVLALMGTKDGFILTIEKEDKER